MSLKRARTQETDTGLSTQFSQELMPAYSQSSMYGSRRRRFRGFTGRYSLRRRRSSYVSRIPRAVTPYNYAYPIARNINIDAPINLSTGWQARGPGLGFSFRLNEIVMQFADATAITKPIGGFTELTSLFDQWRIAKIECKLIYSASNHNSVNLATNDIALPVIHIVTDYDDRTVDSATFNAQEYPQCRTVRLGAIHKHNFVPRVKGYVDGSGVTRAATSGTSSWFDCAVADIDHYGMKVQYDNFGDIAPTQDPNVYVGTCKFQFRIYFQFKNPR